MNIKNLFSLWLGLAAFVSIPSLISYSLGGKLEFADAMYRFFEAVLR